MSADAAPFVPPSIAGEPIPRALGRGVLLASAAGAAVGSLESLRHVAAGAVRELPWLPPFLATAVLGHALLAALLAIPCGILALLLWRAPTHRAALPSTCAGLGAAAGVALFAVSSRVGLSGVLPAALAATLLALALRELLAWIPLPARLLPWIALLALGLTAHGVAAFAHRDSTPAAANAPPSAPRNLVLVTIDTLRADHLGCYGAGDARTPVLDRLAREGVLFEQATAQSNTTGPSHTSMLTGLYPRQHGAHSNGVPVLNSVRALPDVLAQRLGMHTGAFLSGFTLVDEACGLAERFDYYDDQLLAWTWMPQAVLRMRLGVALQRALERTGLRFARADRPAGETVDRALRWVRASRASEPRRPIFLWVHFYDPHAPYDPPADFRRLHAPGFEREEELDWYALPTREREALVNDPELVEHMRARYRGEISYADAQLGRLLEGLGETGVLDDALLLVTSDHGEGLGSHGYWFDHGTFLYDEELHVPLIARFPRGEHAGRRVREQVRLMDLAPTALEWLGIPDALQTSAASLLPLLRGEGAGHPSFASVELSGEHDGFSLGGERLALRKAGHKLIWTSAHWLDTRRVPERLELYDLERDPGELRDLAGETDPADARLEGLRRDLEAFREATRLRSRARDLDPRLIEQFRKLGY